MKPPLCLAIVVPAGGIVDTPRTTQLPSRVTLPATNFSNNATAAIAGKCAEITLPEDGAMISISDCMASAKRARASCTALSFEGALDSDPLQSRLK